MYPLLTGRSITRNRHSTGKEEGRMRSLDVCSMSTRSVSIEIPSGTRHEESASHGILKLLRYEAKESMATKVLLELQSNIMRFDLASRCFSRLLKKPWIAISYSSSEFATQLERFRWAMLQCSCR
mmetsp:Transcript_28693/g.92570  ORF Transcript_28693/g.92570 Transcript_28693/m.92570 type:complete len:125 (-) Transcript_28693:491-865(-)